MKYPGKQIRRVAYTDNELAVMIGKLDNYQAGLYGIEKCNLDSLESLQKHKAFLLGIYINNRLAGIGAVKLFAGYAEIKRMFIDENYRGQRLAGHLLAALETHAINAGKKKIYLETGFLQEAAIKLYQRSGYVVIEKFGAYEPNSVSVFFSKDV